MGDSTYIHSAHNVSNLLYHIVTPTKYRRMALTREVEGCLREICEGIELRWDWVRFLEVGTATMCTTAYRVRPTTVPPKSSG